MKTYKALIKATVNGTSRAIQTEIRASSSTDAKWLLQAIYGFHALASSPTEVSESLTQEATIHAKTPDQQRISNLTANKDRATKALKAERERQKRQTALKTLGALSQTEHSGG